MRDQKNCRCTVLYCMPSCMSTRRSLAQSQPRFGGRFLSDSVSQEVRLFLISPCTWPLPSHSETTTCQSLLPDFQFEKGRCDGPWQLRWHSPGPGLWLRVRATPVEFWNQHTDTITNFKFGQFFFFFWPCHHFHGLFFYVGAGLLPMCDYRMCRQSISY